MSNKSRPSQPILHYIPINMSANTPQQLGEITFATEISQKQAIYLPPSELAIKYAKGIHNHQPATPHPSSTAKGSNPHLIKSIENFYIRPRWLFVRVSGLTSPQLNRRSRQKGELLDGERGHVKAIPNRFKAAWTTCPEGEPRRKY